MPRSLTDLPAHLRRNRLPAAILLLGFGGVVTQSILLREFLTVFHGNEMTIGIILANWMLLTGLGAYLGAKLPETKGAKELIPWMILLNGLLPIFAAFMLPYLRSILYPPGVMIGPAECLAGSAVLLLPLCLNAGALFPLLVPDSSFAGNEALPRSYALESIGSVGGGAVLTVALAVTMSTWAILLLQLFLICAFLIGVPEYRGRPKIPYAAGLLLLLGAFAFFGFRPDAWSRTFLLPGEEIVDWRDTPYQSVTVTRAAGQYNFFGNDALLFTTGDVMSGEESVHFALAQRPPGARVLLLSGGVSGLIPEIEKHAPRRIDYVEIDPAFVSMGRSLGIFHPGSRTSLIPADGRRFVERTRGEYDAALINASDPTTAERNRYYTAEFFAALKRRLAPGGVVSISLASSGEYMGPTAVRLHAILYRTLRTSFDNVMVIPGLKNYYLASDSALTPAVSGILARRGITTQYVNADYLQEDLLAERSREFSASADPSAPVNRDFSPAAYFLQVRLWMQFFDVPDWIIPALFALIFVAAFFRLTGTRLAVFAGGFAGAALEVMLLFGFQILCGYLYILLGALVALYMAGLSAGIFVERRMRRRSSRDAAHRILLFIALLALAVHPLLLLAARVASDFFAALVCGLLMLAAGGGTGCLFACVSIGDLTPGRRKAGQLYGADLLGAALGAVTASLYFVPVLGLASAGYAACGVSLAGGIAAYAARHPRAAYQGGSQ